MKGYNLVQFAVSKPVELVNGKTLIEHIEIYESKRKAKNFKIVVTPFIDGEERPKEEHKGGPALKRMWLTYVDDALKNESTICN